MFRSAEKYKFQSVQSSDVAAAFKIWSATVVTRTANRFFYILFFYKENRNGRVFGTALRHRSLGNFLLFIHASKKKYVIGRFTTALY